MEPKDQVTKIENGSIKTPRLECMFECFNIGVTNWQIEGLVNNIIGGTRYTG